MRENPHYFGPPRPTKTGGYRSPYWPPGVPWDPPAAHAAIGELLRRGGFLAEAVRRLPGKALPRRLQCSCAGEHCLLPVLERVAELEGIPRSDAPPEAPLRAAEAPWVFLVRRFPPAGIGAERLALLGADPAPAPTEAELAGLWGVADLPALRAVLGRCAAHRLEAHATARADALR